MCKTIYNVCLQNTHVPKIFDRMMLFKQEFVVDGLNYSTIETLLLCICANQKDISITFLEIHWWMCYITSMWILTCHKLLKFSGILKRYVKVSKNVRKTSIKSRTVRQLLEHTGGWEPAASKERDIIGTRKIFLLSKTNKDLDKHFKNMETVIKQFMSQVPCYELGIVQLYGNIKIQ